MAALSCCAPWLPGLAHYPTVEDGGGEGVVLPGLAHCPVVEGGGGEDAVLPGLVG